MSSTKEKACICFLNRTAFLKIIYTNDDMMEVLRDAGQNKSDHFF